MKKASIAALILIIATLFSACSSGSASPGDNSGDKYSYDTGASMGEASPTYQEDSLSVSPDQIEQSERKLIKNATYRMQTTAFGTSYDGISKLIDSCGGYVQNSSLSGGSADGDEYQARYLDLVARIPSDSLDDFSEALSTHAAIVSQSIGVDEVTNEYYDIEARINSLEIQEQTLLDILEKAETLTDVISLQTALADVRYEIESLEGTIRRLDNQIAYSTVSIYLEEVRRVDNPDIPVSLGARISARFNDSVNEISDGFSNLAVFFVGNILFFLIWAVLIAIIVIIVRLLITKSNKKAAARAQAAQQMVHPQQPFANGANSPHAQDRANGPGEGSSK